MHDAINSIMPLFEQIYAIANNAYPIYKRHVDSIIENNITDTKQIDKLLEEMLDVCFDEDILKLYKKLCRYYYKIDKEATAEYIYMYREMWDEESLISTL